MEMGNNARFQMNLGSMYPLRIMRYFKRNTQIFIPIAKRVYLQCKRRTSLSVNGSKHWKRVSKLWTFNL